MRHIRTSVVLVVLACCSLTIAAPEKTTLSVAGWPDRAATVYIDSDENVPLAVVMALHGGGHNSEKMAQITCPGSDPDSPPGDVSATGCLNAVAENRGFAVVYPNGTRSMGEIHTWNAGGGTGAYQCVSGYACRNDVDDIAYFSALLDAIETHEALDAQRVYAVGASNGAAMAHRLGCELSGRLAGIGSVAGGNQFAATEHCRPDRSLPIIMIHGDADPRWPYQGGGSADVKVGIPPYADIAPSTALGWIERNGCSRQRHSTRLSDSVTGTDWTGCSGGTAVRLITVAGGGHTWPGGWQFNPDVGQTNREVNASELLLDFFVQPPQAPAAIGEDADPALMDELPIKTRTFDMGTAGFVPKRFPDSTDEDWMDLLESGAAAYGGVFGVHVSPDDEPDARGIPAQVTLAFEHMDGVNPYIAFTASHEVGAFTVERGEQLMRAAVATAETYRPDYLSLGVEINSLYLFEPDSFPLYVDYARQTYDEIKAVSPGTMVMNNFQLDRMRGQTALTGQDFEPHWDLIEQFSGKTDLVSFTVYPYLHYETVEEIPADYLGGIRDHTDLAVIITETGWPTEDPANGASGSDALQIAYLKKLVAQANAIGTDAIVWVPPHDAPLGLAGGIFDNISLMDNDGNPKPAYEYWKAVNALPLDQGTADDLAQALSGLWYDPSLAGEGYNVIVGDFGTVVYFYGHAPDGERLWLISDVLIQPLVLGEEREVNMLVATSGTFDMPGPPDESFQLWGRLSMVFESCTQARFELAGDSGESKISDTIKLLGVAGAACPAASGTGASGE